MDQKITILSFSRVFPNSSPPPHGLLSQSTPLVTKSQNMVKWGIAYIIEHSLESSKSIFIALEDGSKKQSSSYKYGFRTVEWMFENVSYTSLYRVLWSCDEELFWRAHACCLPCRGKPSFVRFVALVFCMDPLVFCMGTAASFRPPAGQKRWEKDSAFERVMRQNRIRPTKY